MIRDRTLLRANFKRHRGTMMGIFTIMLIVSLTLISVLTIWLNTNAYLQEEMNRMHYGDITAWTQDVNNQEQLHDEIKQLDDVEEVNIQQLIYSNYKINGKESDSEGQLIVYEDQQFPYRFFNKSDNGYVTKPSSIESGDIYISPSLISTFNISPGDSISFVIGRQGMEKSFQIKGTFEDPFMGSSMIGMKGFLISKEDYATINDMIEQSGIDALARTGQMYHIQQSKQSVLSNAQFNQVLNEQTTLSEYTSFVHSKDAITSFMLILQNAFTGLFVAFALLLVIVSMIITGFSIGASIEQDQKNIAILKVIGYDGRKLRKLLELQYMSVIVGGLLAGMLLSILSIPYISKVMVSFAGILTPSNPQFILWIVVLLLFLLLFKSFVNYKTRTINRVKPINMIAKESDKEQISSKFSHLHRRNLIISISLRQLLSGKKRYISVAVTAVLLVFFTSMIGRMNTWLGPDGKGMMDAFNPADLDLGVQILGNHTSAEVDDTIQKFTTITDTYALAMQGVTVDGIDYTANVITEPERFHIQQGTTVRSSQEVVITETIAKDRNLTINDMITINNNGRSGVYRIVGIYQCANEMGNNIGMSKDGFMRIGNDTADMWCHHYFLEETDQKQVIIDTLNTTFGGDVYIHENTWPGLFSIIAAMRSLLVMMYIVTAVFIFIVTILTGNKIFLKEKRNLAIYKTLGFTTTQLRITFAIRYGFVAIIGSIIGILMSNIFTDSVVGSLMNLYGIANFASHPGLFMMLIPGIVICLLFIVFSYLISKKIKKVEINELVTE